MMHCSNSIINLIYYIASKEKAGREDKQANSSYGSDNSLSYLFSCITDIQVNLFENKYAKEEDTD